jgi:dihydroorotate dehydrogenase (NAD+) catalytic subunit
MDRYSTCASWIGSEPMPKFDLRLDPPLLNTAGSLGFAPNPHGPLDLAAFGAFVTNPISLGKRSPAHNPQLIAFPGGFLLHTGYPNPGLREVIRRYAQRWARSPLPVIVHLLCQSLGEVSPAVSQLTRLPGVAGIELGLPPDSDASTARNFAASLVAAAGGEFPVILRLPLERAASLAAALAGQELGAISLGPPRGVLLSQEGRPVRGRLFGPAMFPLALAAVQELAQLGFPLIGAGGVYQPAQVQAMRAAGAVAVQLDSVLWRGIIP